MLVGQNKEDFNKKNLEFVYLGEGVKSKIAFSNIYAQNFFDDLGILVFPNFNNKIFSFNKTFYYKFPVSNISFNILPSTNIKENRKENENYNNVTMFNVFYTFSNENPVSITSKSFNTKKEWSLGGYSDFFITSLTGSGIVYKFDEINGKKVFLINSSEEDLNKSQTYLSKYGRYIFSYFNKTKVFSTFCEFNKTNNNRFYPITLSYNVKTEIPKLDSNLSYDYSIIGPNSVIYLESITIE